MIPNEARNEMSFFKELLDKCKNTEEIKDLCFSIKNFNEKLNSKGREYSIFDSDEIDILCTSEKRINVASDSILGKVFGYFFDS